MEVLCSEAAVDPNSILPNFVMELLSGKKQHCQCKKQKEFASPMQKLKRICIAMQKIKRDCIVHEK